MHVRFDIILSIDGTLIQTFLEEEIIFLHLFSKRWIFCIFDEQWLNKTELQYLTIRVIINR